MSKKNYGSVIGLLIGIISIFGTFLLDGGSFKTLFLISPIIVVFGGTFAAVIIGFGFNRFSNIFYLIRLAYFPRHYDIKRIIDLFFDISITIRRDGILAMEKEINLIITIPKRCFTLCLMERVKRILIILRNMK